MISLGVFVEFLVVVLIEIMSDVDGLMVIESDFDVKFVGQGAY